jgi:peptidyl-prolyl cis-trans isomerase SurA
MNPAKAISGIIFCAILACCVAVSSAEVVDKIAVVVNDDIITNSEIERLLIPVYHQYKNMYSGQELISKLEEIRSRIVEQLIGDKLLSGEAKKLGIEATEEEVGARLNEAISQFPNRRAFELAIAGQGLTVKDLKERYKEQLTVRKLINQKVGSRIIITPVEIGDYYKEHSADFARAEEIKLRNILIRKEPDNQKALEIITDISEKLKSGSDFTELAASYSQGSGAPEGGLMGYVKKGDLMPEVESVVFGMKEGDVSGIIDAGGGYYIFKVEERKSEHTRPLSEVRMEIEDAIYRERMSLKVRQLVEDLKKNAYIAFR